MSVRTNVKLSKDRGLWKAAINSPCSQLPLRFEVERDSDCGVLDFLLWACGDLSCIAAGVSGAPLPRCASKDFPQVLVSSARADSAFWWARRPGGSWSCHCWPFPGRAYPIEQYPSRTRAAAAIMHMIMNNLDPAVAQVMNGRETEASIVQRNMT